MKGVGEGSEGSEDFFRLQILGQQNNGRIQSQQGLGKVRGLEKK